MNDIVMWLSLLLMFCIAAKHKFEWVTSIRSLVTLIVVLTFCDMAFNKLIDPKDFMLIVSLVLNFYFIVKNRNEGGLNEQK
jgi:hypothetical protein